MEQVEWIKVRTDIFSDDKIKLIRKLPDGDTMFTLWIMFLCLAGKQNYGGTLMMNGKIAYNDEMLSSILDEPLPIIRAALKTFESFDMIEIEDGRITITNWEKHQNVEALDRIREQGRLRVQKFRQKKQEALLLEQCNVTCNVTSRYSNGTEEDKDKDIDREEDISSNNQNINVSEKDLNKLNLNNQNNQKDKLNNIFMLGIYGNVPMSEEQLQVLKEECPDSYMERINQRSIRLHEKELLANVE